MTLDLSMPGRDGGQVYETIRKDKELADLPVIRPWQHPDTLSAWHLYVIQVDPLRTPVARGTLFERLRLSGVGVNVHYIPVHTQPYYRALGFEIGAFPAAEDYYARALSIPLFPKLTHEHQDQVVDALISTLSLTSASFPQGAAANVFPARTSSRLPESRLWPG